MVYLLSFAAIGALAMLVWLQHEFIRDQHQAYRALVEAVARREGVKVVERAPIEKRQNPYYVDPNPNPQPLWPGGPSA